MRYVRFWTVLIFFLITAITVFFYTPSETSAQSTTLVCPAPPAPDIPLAVGQIQLQRGPGKTYTCGPGNYFNIGKGGPNQPQTECDNLAAGVAVPVGGQYKYNQLSGGFQRVYTPIANLLENGDDPRNFTCNITLGCQQSCVPPQVIGICDLNCNFAIIPSSLQCLQYGGAQSFDITIVGPGTGVMSWDDGKQDTPVEDGSPVAHTYDNAGVYDIRLNCNQGGQLCSKRVNVLCQQCGGGGPTPTPLPTATPTPTGGASCAPGLQCMDPCACNTNSAAYQQSCPNGPGSAIGSKKGKQLAKGDKAVLGTQLAQAVGGAPGSIADGGACGPGLVCCQAAPSIGTDPWWKVKDGAFHKLGNLVDPIPDPDNADPFDNNDDGLCDQTDPLSITCLNINQPGVVSAHGFIDTAHAPISYRGWKLENGNYNLNNVMTPTAFRDYVIARKTYVQINDFSEMQNDTVNYIVGDYTINNNGHQGKSNFILIIDGNLTVDQNNQFNPSNKPMGFVVTGKMSIRSNVEEMNGIYIAQDVDFASDILPGNTTENELKVDGNLVSFTESECTEKRQRTDNNNKPSCFFVHNIVDHYLPLMDMLSVRTYEWEELVP